MVYTIDELYDAYLEAEVDDWATRNIEDEEKLEELQNALERDGDAKTFINNFAFNLIKDSLQKAKERRESEGKPVGGFLKDFRKHALVKKAGDFVGRTQQTLEPLVAKEESKRVGDLLKEARSQISQGHIPKVSFERLEGLRVVTDKGERSRRDALFETQRGRGKVVTAYREEVKASRSQSEAQSVLAKAESELAGKDIESIREAVRIRGEEL